MLSNEHFIFRLQVGVSKKCAYIATLNKKVVQSWPPTCPSTAQCHAEGLPRAGTPSLKALQRFRCKPASIPSFARRLHPCSTGHRHRLLPRRASPLPPLRRRHRASRRPALFFNCEGDKATLQRTLPPSRSIRCHRGQLAC